MYVEKMIKKKGNEGNQNKVKRWDKLKYNI